MAYHIHVKGKYIGTINATLAEIKKAFPYSDITNGCRVHVWAR